MRPVILAILYGGGVFLLASATRNKGWLVSDQLCQQGAVLCDNPGMILTIGVALVLVAAVHAMIRT